MKSGLFMCLLFCICSGHTDLVGRSKMRPELREFRYDIRAKRQSEGDKRIMCFYASWSITREGANKFTPEDINAQLCTHIVYGYARPELKEGIVPYDTKIDVDNKLWTRFVDLKKSNPKLKAMLAVGGILEGSTRFSRMAADPTERQIFVRSSSSTLREFGFDGLEVSWVYPGFSQGSSSSDKLNYVSLLKELRREFGGDLLLSLTIPGLDGLIDAGYDLPQILKYVDFINVWAGGYHASTDPTVNHPSPLYNFQRDETTKYDNVNATISSLIRRGVPPAKLNLLISNFGLYFILEDPNVTGIGAPTEDEGENSEWRGGTNFNDLCLKIMKENWTVKRVNAAAVGPYAYKGKEWLAWDDEIIIRNKARYALEKNIGGVGFWTVDMDDFKGACQRGKYPLLKAARQVFLTTTESPVSSMAGSPTLTTPEVPTSPSRPDLVPDGGPDGVPLTEYPTLTARTEFQKTPSPPPPEQTPFRAVKPLKPTDNPLHVKGSSKRRFNGSIKTGKKGVTIYQSNRDIVFQNIKIWIYNHFYDNFTPP